MKCEICNKEYDSIRKLSVHISLSHKEIKIKDYYDMYLKKENEGMCYFCGDIAKYHNLSKGYHRICNSSICLGKTRATGTFEFLMYKYGFTEEEAKKEQQIRARLRGKKIKNSFDELLKENPNFNKENSHHSKNHWMKRGMSEEDATSKVKEIMKDIGQKVSFTRQNNKENYLDIIPTQLAYWLKKGYNEVEAKEKLKERQTTFTLDICIEKYGKIEGKRRWIERQKKWSLSYKKSNFSKISQKLFWSLYNEIENKEHIHFATLKNYIEDSSGCNNEYRLQLKDGIIIPDFLDFNSKKIIEFDGTYYHRNTPENVKRNIKRDEMIVKSEYVVLHISENDYKKYPEDTIKKCIEFLNEKY